jgi:D-2-hydroxyacid dehydrogenase (NADP+)
VLPTADVVALTCPLTRETENLIDAKALALMKPTAHLVNVARGARRRRRRRDPHARGEAHCRCDVMREEPLPPDTGARYRSPIPGPDTGA